MLLQDMSGKRDVISNHMMFLGVQSDGIQRRGLLTHLFVPSRSRRLPFRNARAQLDRLRGELQRVFPKSARPLGENAPRTMRVVFRRPAEPLRVFLQREEAGVRQHVALRQAPTRSPPVIECLTDVFQTDPIVPRLHFAGYHPTLDAYVTVMSYAPGAPPSAGTSATALAAIERALFTIWMRGVALPDLPKGGVRVSATGAFIVDFTGARSPLKNVRAVQSSRNPLFPELWDPPRWLPALVRRRGKALDAARRAAWLWSPACDGPAGGGNNSAF